MTRRGAALIAAALVLCGALIGVQLALGGGQLETRQLADPCQPRTTAPPSNDLEALAEQVVLLGLDDAACTLGVSREQLVLALGTKRERAALAREQGTDERGLALALQRGMRRSVDQLEASGQLPPTPVLARATADQLGLPPALVRLIPDAAFEQLPPTADLLRWSLDQVDVTELLAALDAGKPLEPVLREQLTQAIQDELARRLRTATDQLGGALSALGFG